MRRAAWKVRLFSAGCLAGLLAIVGCSQESDGFYPVKGKVTANGKAITVGSVTFRPDASKGNKTMHHPTGNIEADGTYTLYTISKPGAPPGWYRVMVFADGNPNPQPGVPPQWLHDAKYTLETTTDLRMEVTENPPAGAYDLKLSR